MNNLLWDWYPCIKECHRESSLRRGSANNSIRMDNSERLTLQVVVSQPITLLVRLALHDRYIVSGQWCSTVTVCVGHFVQGFAKTLRSSARPDVGQAR